MSDSSLFLGQSATGYRYNRDSFLLADFATIHPHARILDACAGAGVVGILLARRRPGVTVTALEINPEQAVQAGKNAIESGVEKYRAVIGDIRQASKLFRPGSFDLIVSNPPYRKKGTGRLNVDPAKAVARHELFMTLADLVTVAKELLSPSGALALTMIAERREEYLELLTDHGLTEAKYRLVRSRLGDSPQLFLSEAMIKERGSNGEAIEEETLVIKTSDGQDSDQYRQIEGRLLDE